MTTMPENGNRPFTEAEVDQMLEGYVGRRVLKKGQVHSGLGGKREVFRYEDFVAGIWGGNANGQQENVNG